MSKAQQTLAQAFLERVSRGAVPMGGFYWVDPKALRSQSTSVEATAATPEPTARQASATTDARAPASAMAWRPAALAQRIGLFLIGAHASIREPSQTVSTGCTQHAPGERS